jgi:hypothetical protein
MGIRLVFLFLINFFPTLVLCPGKVYLPEAALVQS